MGGEQLIELALLALAFAAGWILRGGAPGRTDSPAVPLEQELGEREELDERVAIRHEPRERDVTLDALLEEAGSALEGAIRAYHEMVSASTHDEIGRSSKRKAIEPLIEQVARLGGAVDRLSTYPAGDDPLLQSLGNVATELAEVNGRLMYGRSDVGLDELLDRLEQTLASTARALSALGRLDGARRHSEANGSGRDAAAVRIGPVG